MGQDITTTRFSQQDYHRFERRLASEMALLHDHFRMGRFSEAAPSIGLELELWLVDPQGRPQPENEAFLARVDCATVAPELSRYNVEFNVEPQALHDAALHHLGAELAETWASANRVAAELGLRLVSIGTLPTLRDRDLNLAAMSDRSRFRALNEQILKLRRGRAIRIEIQGVEELHVKHHDAMLEAATTSLQMHLQVPVSQAARYYNAALIASAATTAVSANSPLLFGKQLWAETRIPIFEQAVDLGGPYPRVSFGHGYAVESLEEVFLENRAFHPVLLPCAVDEPVELLPHVRLHNGTIWRWNRPVIGFDDAGAPHVRIEHRVMSAGPTIADMLADLAFAAGLIQDLARRDAPPESSLSFEQAAENFYAAARHGLAARIAWLDGHEHALRRLIAEELLPAAERGLRQLQIAPVDIQRLLGILAERVKTGQNGSVWQAEFWRRNGQRPEPLVQAYLQRQHSGQPVHDWEL